jgi:hypothetical protein
VQGMAPPPPGRFTAGRSGLPGMTLNGAPAFGTVCGTQTPVKLSGSSPAGHWASGVASGVGTAKTAIAGAAATATANPPARISRRAESWKVAIVTLSVVIDRVVGWIVWKLEEICIRSTSSLGMCRARLRSSRLPTKGLEALLLTARREKAEAPLRHLGWRTVAAGLRAGADRGTRNRLRALGLLFLGQADALTGIRARAGNPVDFRQPAGRSLAELW